MSTTCCHLPSSFLLSWPFLICLQGTILLFSYSVALSLSPSLTLSPVFSLAAILPPHSFLSQLKLAQHHCRCVSSFVSFKMACIQLSYLFLFRHLTSSDIFILSSVSFSSSFFFCSPFSSNLLWPLRPAGNVLWPQPRWHRLLLLLLPALPYRLLLPLFLLPPPALHSAQWDNSSWHVIQSSAWHFFPLISQITA